MAAGHMVSIFAFEKAYFVVIILTSGSVMEDGLNSREDTIIG